MPREVSEQEVRAVLEAERAENIRGALPLDRRQMLRGAVWGGAAAAAAALARGAAVAQTAPAEGTGNLPPNTPEWMTQQGAPILSPPYGLPSEFEKDVVRQPTDLTATATASWSFTPLQDLHGIITPNGLFFERHHGGVPAIDPEQHRLMVHGMVERPVIFTMNDLMRFPAVSRIHFLECSGNSLTEYVNPEPSVQTTHGLVSCCEWTGVPLATILQEAGVESGAAWVLAEGADAAAMTRSIPLSKAFDDALLAYSQNGERLRPEQGYPLRLLLPGYEGNMSIKWLRRLEVGPEPWYTREETSKYTDLMPDGSARKFTFAMEAKSVITHPAGGGKPLGGPGFHEISGLAWSGYGRISRVDVTTDGGRNWRTAELDQPVLAKCLTRFRLPWQWNGEPALLASRAIDESGYVQPTREQLLAVRGQNSVYHYNAIQTWRLAESGEVSNAAV
ncbi:sulfite dehydrogenase [Virgifigura deserti]|uniref:sulfite dehydrogenase n=1 Tax=Virgifigura deserti TaxID=2268457 RepID=UPI003CCC3773